MHERRGSDAKIFLVQLCTPTTLLVFLQSIAFKFSAGRACVSASLESLTKQTKHSQTPTRCSLAYVLVHCPKRNQFSEI